MKENEEAWKVQPSCFQKRIWSRSFCECQSGKKAFPGALHARIWPQCVATETERCVLFYSERFQTSSLANEALREMGFVGRKSRMRNTASLNLRHLPGKRGGSSLLWSCEGSEGNEALKANDRQHIDDSVTERHLFRRPALLRFCLDAPTWPCSRRNTPWR